VVRDHFRDLLANINGFPGGLLLFVVDELGDAQVLLADVANTVMV
jgi:hypothetical protein